MEAALPTLKKTIGILLFVTGITVHSVVEAQETSETAAKGYLIIEHGVPTPEIMAPLQEYSTVSNEALERYGGRFIIADNTSIQSIEGGWEPPFIIVIEFPSYENAKAFYFSDEYQSVLPDRLAAFKDSRSILVEGRGE